MLAFTQAQARSLASTVSGDFVQIEHILFEGLRARCADLGIHEGDQLRCRSATSAALIFETTVGRLIALEREWAQFIQVGAPSR